MFARKPLAIALTVVMLIAMLVPAAMAAPETAHGVTIVSPTGASPAYVNPEDVPNNYFTLKYNIQVVGFQTTDVAIKYMLLSKYFGDEGKVVNEYDEEILNGSLQTGANAREFKFVVDEAQVPVELGELNEGWYDLKVCILDENPDSEPWCDTQANAVLLQETGPKVELLKPAELDWNGAALVTGKAYLTVAKAWDKFGVVKVEFQFCDPEEDWNGCRKASPSWIKVADGVPTANVPNQWQANWDTTNVPDSILWHDPDEIRVCAWNHVGLTNCANGPDDWRGRDDAHEVYVTNRFEVDLQPGWNLISLPAMPYNPAITDVLFHLIDKKTVLQVSTFVWEGANLVEKKWSPSYNGGLSEFSTMKDGQGYWIKMATEDDLTVKGTYLAFPPMTPPQYNVNVGWNLIGYTQFGQPWWFPTKLAADYLGLQNSLHAQALWLYDAQTEVFWQQLMLDPMAPGHGFWLAMDAPGAIRP